MFIDKDTAPLANKMLRARVRIQSQADPAKLRAMLVELQTGGPTPIYDQMMRESSRSLRTSLRLAAIMDQVTPR